MTLPRGADYSPTESALIPFQAEPIQFCPRYALLILRQCAVNSARTSAGISVFLPRFTSRPSSIFQFRKLPIFFSR
jgi:hypothetical protein